jgi:hypothetical protein
VNYYPLIYPTAPRACRQTSKVLAAHLYGGASVAELTRYVVKRTGLDRPDAAVGRVRTKARNCWRWICAAGRSRLGITDPGRQFLASLEAPIPAHAEEQAQPSGRRVKIVTAPSQVQPTLRLVVDTRAPRRPASVRMKHGGLRDRCCDQGSSTGGKGYS